MLAYHQAKPLYQANYLGGAEMPLLGKRLKNYLETHTADVRADVDALRFYLMNHSVGLIRARYHELEPLPNEVQAVLDSYAALSSEMAMRAFYYLYIICSREARHSNGKTKGSGTNLETVITAKYGTNVWAAAYKVISGSSTGVVEFLKAPGKNVRIEDFVGALKIVFYQGNWSSSYGGPAWGKVTDCLYDFIVGKTTPEMLLDTVWTLAHNNGPIFNKGWLYSGYSSDLIKVLDVQRSGQIPQLFWDYQKGNKYFDSDIQAVSGLYSTVEGALQYPELRGHLDWWKVEHLGSVGTYNTFKNAQEKLSGFVSPYKAKPVTVSNGVKKPVPDAQKAKDVDAMDYKEYYSIGNAMYKKLTREEVHGL